MKKHRLRKQKNRKNKEIKKGCEEMMHISHSFFSWVQAPFGAVGIGIGTRTWAVLSSIPEG